MNLPAGRQAENKKISFPNVLNVCERLLLTMPEPAQAPKFSLSFAKLVATPTDNSWSQAYNAGNVFICVSLTVPEVSETISLHSLGKDLFNVLESEFFTLQEKSIPTIKEALHNSLASIPEHVTVGLTLTYFKDNALFVFIAGGGKIVMKRNGEIGVLLAKEGSDRTITAASGFVNNTDIIVLETGQFAHLIPREIMTQALELELPNDIVEALSPQMHQHDNGGQAAIVISYRSASLHTEEPETQNDPETISATNAPLYPQQITHETQVEAREQEYEQEEYGAEEKKKPFSLPKMPALPAFNRFHFSFNHRRRLFLNIALILTLLLILSIFFTVKKYHDDKEKALFQSIYPPAQQYYSEGKGLATVNASLSQDSYRKAQTLLNNGQSKFGKGSKEYEEITSLLSQVDSSLQNNTTGQSTNATAIQPQAHSLLAVAQSMSGGIAFGQDSKDIYAITNTAITAVSKSDGSTNTLIKNNNYWSSPVAIVPYNGNFYVLDQKKGLLKFVAGSGGYGRDYYFKNNGPDLSSATGMAIDASVWLLFKDGSIMQYTSGKSNNIQVSGLIKPMNNPTKIVTDINTEGIYVLDANNSRIVKFDKTGKYQSSYTASVLANAKDFTIDETNKKIQVLSGGKVWEMNL